MLVRTFFLDSDKEMAFLNVKTFCRDTGEVIKIMGSGTWGGKMEAFAEKLLKHAKNDECPVLGIFNGSTMLAKSWMTLEQVTEQYPH